MPIMFHFDMPPADVVEHFRIYFGPTQKAFESLDAEGQAAFALIWKSCGNRIIRRPTAQLESRASIWK